MNNCYITFLIELLEMKKLDISIESAPWAGTNSTHEIIDYVEFQISSILTYNDNSDLAWIAQIMRQIDTHLFQNQDSSIDKDIRFIESRKYLIELFIRRMKFDWLRNNNLENVHTKLKELFKII